MNGLILKTKYMNFFKTSFFSSISTSVDLITKLISNKIVAVYLGTSGMFLLGQLKDFVKLAQEFGQFGITNGTIKYTAYYKDEDSILSEFLGTGFKIHLFFSLLVMTFIILFNKSLSFYLFNDSQYSSYLILLAFSLVNISVHTFFMSVINGLRNIKLYVLINVVSTILSAILLIVLTIKFKLLGTFYAVAINQILIFIISLFFVILIKPFHLKFITTPFKKDKFKKLSRFTLMAIAGSACLILATLFVRYFLSKELSDDFAGAWEGMWRISAIYLLFLTTTFKFYLLPTFSTLEGKDLKKEVFKIWSYIFPIVLLISVVVFFVKDWIIVLLFSPKFLIINSIIFFHLLGDTIKINCWVLGNVLISKEKTTAFVLFQIEWALVFGFLTYFLVQFYGFPGVAYAYFISYIIHFTLLNLYFKNLLWSK